MKHHALIAIILVGCASADPPHDVGPDSGGVPPTIDAPGRDAGSAQPPPPDAPPAPVTVTLTQVSTNALAASSLACSGNGTTSKQAYYRVFDLAAHGITTPLAVSSIAFGVQSEDGTQVVTVNVGTYGVAPGTTLNVGASTADFAGSVTPLATATKTLTPAATGTIVSVPITATVPGGSRLIVEIRSPDDTALTNVALFLGASSGTETTPGFFWSPDCGAVPPGTPVELGQTAVPFLITATGIYTP